MASESRDGRGAVSHSGKGGKANSQPLSGYCGMVASRLKHRAPPTGTQEPLRPVDRRIARRVELHARPHPCLVPLKRG